MKQSAEFSACGQFRHQLVRIWDLRCEGIALLPFILLNPSKAGQTLPDGTQREDPTSNKGIGFSKRLGYGGMAFANLYDYCATNPADLKRAGYPRSPDADEWIRRTCALGDGIVLCGWGANARGLSRPAEVLQLVRQWGFKPMALRLLAGGIPEHPLMLPYTCELAPI